MADLHHDRPARDEQTSRSLMDISRIIASSPALLARERQILSRYAESLAGLLAMEAHARNGDLRPTVAAQAMIDLHAALIALVRRRLSEGIVDARRIAREARVEGERGMRVLEEGLGSYAVKM